MGVGWITAIVIGGVAGWLAEQVMKSNMGIFMNIILGIVGSVLLNWVLGLLDISFQFGPGWLTYLITGFVGAVVLIFIARIVRR